MWLDDVLAFLWFVLDARRYEIGFIAAAILLLLSIAGVGLLMGTEQSSAQQAGQKPLLVLSLLTGL